MTDLTGERVGDHVTLHWTSPSRTSDGLDLTGPTTVEICRDPAPVSQPNVPAAKTRTPAAAVPCTPILATVGHPGEAAGQAQLPANSLTAAGQPQLIAYRVRILNSAGRSAPPSAPVLAPGGPAPAVVSGFHAVQQKAGVVLEWDKASGQGPSTIGADEVEVLRTVQTLPSGSAGTQGAKSLPAKRNPKSKKPDSSVRAGQENRSAPVRLQQTRGKASLTADQPRESLQKRDGMVDESVLEGATYLYTAQRVIKVSLAGSIFEIHSEPTAAVVVAVHDVFPPDPPKGLFGVPGSTGSSRTTIDLSWEPNIEGDLAGYFVYRTDPGKGKPVRLTDTPVPGPSYADSQVLAGLRYTYVVTAIDRNGNESRPSAPFQTTSIGP